MTKKYPSDEQDRFLVRLPTGMRQQIADLAKANGRSMNSEIIHHLEKALGASQDEAQSGGNDLQGMLLIARLDLSSVANAVDALKPQLPPESPETRLLSIIAKRYRLSKTMVAKLEQEHMQKQSSFMRQLIEQLERQAPRAATE